MTNTKTCAKCSEEKPADLQHFYRHAASKSGLTPRCKPCVNVDNAAGRSKQLLSEPERVRALASARTMRNYRKDINASRLRHRGAATKRRADPVARAKINMRKRAGGAGLTPDEWNALFEKQGCRCAICRSDEPGSRAGWNTDHCHRTKRVRFILCAHCNRGLGAFKDNPDLMGRAADMLSELD